MKMIREVTTGHDELFEIVRWDYWKLWSQVQPLDDNNLHYSGIYLSRLLILLETSISLLWFS